MKKKTLFMTLIIITLFFAISIFNDKDSQFIKDAGMKKSEIEKEYSLSSDVVLKINNTPLTEPLPVYLSAVYINSSNSKKFRYSEDFNLEKKIKNSWYTFPITGDYFIPSIAHSLEPHSIGEVKYYISQYHNNMGPGIYRIVSQVDDVTMQDNNIAKQRYDENYENVICEFSIE